MKQIFLLISLLLSLKNTTFCQVQITSGANLTTTGNVHIVIADLDLTNAGTLDAAGATFHFTGTGNNSVKDANGFLTFNNITINKTIGAHLDLHTTLYVNGIVQFISGNIDLNDKYIHLGNTGSLVGESETSRATSSSYGLINANAVLNAPNGANIGNLGAIITSTADLGSVYIVREHNSINIPSAGGKSVNRSFAINPSNNNALDATVTIKYFDAELNGLDKNNLTQFEGTDLTTYNNMNYSARDAATNYVTQTGYHSLNKFTLSNFTGLLPVRLIGFSAQCIGNFIQLNWETAIEQNSDRFDIQRSTNGTAWETIGSVKSAGNSLTALAYQYDDRTLTAASSFYRLAQYDLDGKISYSSTVNGGCSLSTTFQAIPNPVVDVARVVIGASTDNKGSLLLFNAAGQQVMQQAITLASGVNQYQLNMAELARGIYSLVLVQNGVSTKSIKIIRQ